MPQSRDFTSELPQERSVRIHTTGLAIREGKLKQLPVIAASMLKGKNKTQNASQVLV